MADETTEVTVMPGAFEASLKRNNAKIRQDRAVAIVENAQIVYKRSIEDFELEIKRLKRDQENMIDLSPTHADSLILASDFKAKDYTDKDISIGVEIRNLEIKLEIAKKRYQYLFGGNI